MPKNKCEPKLIKLEKTKVGQERFEQLLAEVGEILYKRLCQHVRAQNNSAEPALKQLEKTPAKRDQFKKAVS